MLVTLHVGLIGFGREGSMGWGHCGSDKRDGVPDFAAMMARSMALGL